MAIRGYTVNCSILFTDLPLPQRPRAARAAGFEAVEFWWPFVSTSPTGSEVDTFVRSVGDAGVTLSGLNFAAGALERGERGLLSNPATAQQFRDSVEIAVDIGARLGTTGFNALYGNRIDGIAAAAQDELATENIAFAAERAATIGADVLIEPISGIADHPISTLADAAAVVDRVGSESVRILADLYHLAVNGEDLPAAVAGYADRIGHVQIADTPGRGEPGTGGVDLFGTLDLLVECGYSGWVSAEYVATRSDTFDWLFVSERGQHHTAGS